MGAQLIVQMDGKMTSLQKPRQGSQRNSVRDINNEFTFDYSYWSFDKDNGTQFTDQDQVYEDLGTDVINCAFQGKQI